MIGRIASRGINDIEKRFKKIKLLFIRKEWTDVDEMFFSFEPLPIRGKEYWFLLFTSPESKNGMQFMVTFGRYNMKKISINGKTISKKQFDDNSWRCALSAWYYNGKLNKIPTFASKVKIENNEIHATGKKFDFAFSGKYPEYKLNFSESGKEICNLKFSEAKNDRKYLVSEYFRGGLGFGNINLYLDFEGKLDGSDFKGRCYVQKVVITAPIPNVPWNWGRICFKDGSLFEFLQPYVALTKFKRKFSESARFYDAKTDKVHTFDKVDVLKFGRRKTQFLVHAKSETEEVTMMTRTCGLKKFKIGSIGALAYDEHLVNVSSFSFECMKKHISLDDLGNGVGLLEDGHGYVV